MSWSRTDSLAAFTCSLQTKSTVVTYAGNGKVADASFEISVAAGIGVRGAIGGEGALELSLLVETLPSRVK